MAEPESIEIVDDEGEHQTVKVEQMQKVVDREHDARRARLLEAKQQMAHRRELASNELETLRLMKKAHKEASPHSPEDEKMESADEKKKKKMKQIQKAPGIRG